MCGCVGVWVWAHVCVQCTCSVCSTHHRVGGARYLCCTPTASRMLVRVQGAGSWRGVASRPRRASRAC